MSEKDNFKAKLQECDDRIAELKAAIEKGKALERLHESKDFDEIVLSGYFEKEAERIFGLLTTPTSLKRDQLDNLMDKLSAIRNFKHYFKTVLIDAAMAPEQIEEEEAYRKNLTAENSQLPKEIKE